MTEKFPVTVRTESTRSGLTYLTLASHLPHTYLTLNSHLHHTYLASLSRDLPQITQL